MKSKETITGRVVSEDKSSVYYYTPGEKGLQRKELSRKQVKRIRYEVPPKDSNAILLRFANISGKDLFSAITTFLLKSGYQIERFDTDLLKVITKLSSNHRFVVKIDENTAKFVTYEVIDETRGKTYSAGSENVIKFNNANEPKQEPEEFPGEEINYAGESEFKEMDKLCRNFLMDNKGSLIYTRK